MLWIRLAFRQIMGNKGFALFFILNLAMGLAGFVAVLSFGRSLDRHMNANLKEILTADIEISAQAPLTSKELSLAGEVLGKDTAKARLVRFYTMARTGGDARLAEVLAIDENYPLYGAFKLSNRTPVSHLKEKPVVFMTRDTAQTFGFAGDKTSPLVLGDKAFEVADIFSEDPDTSLSSFEFAPKLYMGIEQLEGTG